MPTCAPTKLIPGPKGDPGTNGLDGTDGINAFTVLTANFTMPIIGATGVATVEDSSWFAVGQPVYLQNGGVLYVTAVGGPTSVTLRNPAAETGNVAAGTVIPTGSKVSPSGFKGNAGSAGATGGGVTVATKGDIQTYAGAPANLAVGTDGQILRSLASAGTGLDWEQIVPNASASTDNRVAVSDSPAGTETPSNLQFLPLKIQDTGAIQNDNGGNARGVDATDLQPARAANTQVASGNNSTIGGGRNNTSSGQGSTVAGGEGNVSSGADSTVAGGANNTASAQNAAIVGGDTNVSSGTNSFVGAGNLNQATGAAAFVGGGISNVASNTDSAVLAGSNNVASGTDSCVGAGSLNTASGSNSTVAGGSANTASATHSSVPGGNWALANKYGQTAHASGRFSVAGDSQTSELLWKRATTDATANQEMFLDAAGTQRATIVSGSTWAFHIIGVARRDNGTSISFEVKGAIQNNAGTTGLVAAVTAAVVADGTGGALAIGNFTVDADNANSALRIRVTGIAGQNWHWLAHARLVELIY